MLLRRPKLTEPPDPDEIWAVLPKGVSQFHEWAAYIIEMANVTATEESQKFVLANLLLELPSDRDMEKVGYFVKRLRKSAVNQVAEAMRQEIRDTVKARKLAEDKQNQAEATPPAGSDAKVLGDPVISTP